VRLGCPWLGSARIRVAFPRNLKALEHESCAQQEPLQPLGFGGLATVNQRRESDS